MFFQAVSTSAPRGVTSPRPVTTTRRIAFSPSINSRRDRIPENETASRPLLRARDGKPLNAVPAHQVRDTERRSALLMLVDVGHRIADRGDLLGRVVGDLDAEFFLESHDQLDDVEAV